MALSEAVTLSSVIIAAAVLVNSPFVYMHVRTLLRHPQ